MHSSLPRSHHSDHQQLIHSHHREEETITCVCKSTMLDYHHLPEEVILIDILTRLPVKTLMQIRCICKSWYALINSPNFITAHINRTIAHNTTPLLLLRHQSDDVVKEEHYSVHCDETFVECKSLECPSDHSPISFFDKYHSPISCFRIVGSCNGLICLFEKKIKDIIILWNPAIDKSITLPKIPGIKSDSNECIFGFGFDSRTDDYKVVKIVLLFDTFNCALRPKVDVYDLSTGLWRRSGSAASRYHMDHMNLCHWSHVFVNGASHWSTFVNRASHRYLILSFDMGSEEVAPWCDGKCLPCSVSNGTTLNAIALFGESLSLFHYDDAFWSRSKSCCIWVMKECGVENSWTKLVTVDLGGINRVLRFREMDEVLVEKGNGKLVSYDAKSKKEVDTGIRGFKFSFHLDTYMESLVLLGAKKKS